MNDTQPEAIRLNKLLAESLGLSRREVDEAIEKGQVTIDGVRAQLGARVMRGQQAVIFNGAPVATTLPEYRYIMLNKPANYVCSRKQQGGTPTIYSLLPTDYASLKTVGRLDKDSSGLLLLTDDGDFAHQMTHPKFAKAKRYEVELDRPLEPLHQQMISDHGVMLPDGPSKFSVSSIEAIKTTNEAAPRSPLYEVILREGRNRQIRRTFTALGYTVVSLHRTTFGPYQLNGLASGDHETSRRI